MTMSSDDLETRVEQQTPQTTSQEGSKRSRWEGVKDYLRGCVDPANARLYGSFQERAALNVTQFPKIQGSLLIRMGMVYPLMSYLVEKAGMPKDCATDLWGMTINYHTWVAGYLAYLSEIQLGLSKYPIELVADGIKRVQGYFAKK